ncbi:ice-binding family protein, partial [Nesterenkonia muleiensis]|uniref:ice-binding family protein n=1 Tax=Nesterenkonia muleiensis TaxID=2282648 RepID=UPI00192E42D7
MRSRTSKRSRPTIFSPLRRVKAAGIAFSLAVGATFLLSSQPAYSIGTSVDLGTAESFSVLSGESVTNTGPSVLDRDLGVSPGSSITGFPPGTVWGTTHQTNGVALQAQSDLTIAYDDAAGQASDASVSADIGGVTLSPGVYTASDALGITGTLTLDAQGDPNAVFIFQVGSTLITAPGSTVALQGGAQSCNVFWKVGSSATLDTSTTFVGTIMALTSITANTGTTVDGRTLARNGSVTLHNNVFTTSSCETDIPPTTPPVEESPPAESSPPVEEPSPSVSVPAEEESTPPVVGETPPVESSPPVGEPSPSVSVPAGEESA